MEPLLGSLCGDVGSDPGECLGVCLGGVEHALGLGRTRKEWLRSLSLVPLSEGVFDVVEDKVIVIGGPQIAFDRVSVGNPLQGWEIRDT